MFEIVLEERTRNGQEEDDECRRPVRRGRTPDATEVRREHETAPPTARS